MPSNRGVVYTGPDKVSVESLDYPELVLLPGPGVPPINENRPCPHGVILKGGQQHLWERAAYGPGPDHRSPGARTRARDHR
jgi:hypothetical protein